MDWWSRSSRLYTTIKLDIYSTGTDCYCVRNVLVIICHTFLSRSIWGEIDEINRNNSLIIHHNVSHQQGPIYPSLHYLIAHWAPPDEKGKFIACLMGNACGTIITWPLVSVLIENFNWSLGFYVPAAITFITSLIWFYLVADSPSSHPRIGLKESQYIQQSLAGSLAKQKSIFPPMLMLLTSIPFWSLALLHYGNTWGLFFLLSAAPKYMSEVLGFNLSKTGILSALPYAARMLFGFLFGAIGDALLKRNFVSKTMIRKSFCLFCKFFIQSQRNAKK